MEEGEQLAANMGVPYVETSAKDNINVDDTFDSLALRVRVTRGTSSHRACILRVRFNLVVVPVSPARLL